MVHTFRIVRLIALLTYASLCLICLSAQGWAQVSTGGTIRGVARPVTASGHYAPPRPSNFGEIAGLQLQTSFDRREFGFEWQMELPGGDDAVGWDVEVDIDLLLKREDADAEG